MHRSWEVRDLPLETCLRFRWRDQANRLRIGDVALFNDRGVLRQGEQLVALLEEKHTRGFGSSNEAAVAWVEARS